jgi:hypothetical protein
VEGLVQTGSQENATGALICVARISASGVQEQSRANGWRPGPPLMKAKHLGFGRLVERLMTADHEDCHLSAAP